MSGRLPITRRKSPGRGLRAPPIVAALALAVAGCVALEFGRVGMIGTGAGCDDAAAYRPAAEVNAVSQTTLPVLLFGRPELGWAIYAPAIAREARTACPADSTGFAAALVQWQRMHGLTPHGAVDPPSLAAMKAAWQAQRPFVALRAKGGCPDPPAHLINLTLQESRADKPVQLRPAALAALRRMVGTARREVPEVAANPELLTVFSGYRDPADDAARCAREQNCQGLVRAECSSHRTGLAVDLNLGSAPGFAVDSSDDTNRLFQSRTAAYRWLAANARRFGFINYVFEPWHWEWTGEPP